MFAEADAEPRPAPRRDPKVVSHAMRRVRGTDTKPELTLRKALWRRGLRYRLRSNLPGRPDLVFPGRRAVVFVDGDYWHGRQWTTRGFESLSAQMSRVNDAAYWIRKIGGNVERDLRVTRDLEALGWRVIRVWETDLNRKPADVVDAVAHQLRGETP